MDATLAPTMGDPTKSSIGSERPANGAVDQATLQQRTVLAFSRRTIAQSSLPDLMQDAVGILSEVLRTPRGAVAEIQNDRIQLRLTQRNQPSQPLPSNTYTLSAVDSLAAFAIRSGNIVASRDLKRDTNFTDTFLAAQGMASALAIPLFFNGKPFGVLAVLDAKLRTFTESESTFAETIAHLLSASIARIKAEQLANEARDFRAGLMGMIDAMVLTLDAEGRIVEMNQACENATQFRFAEVRNQPVWQTLVPPEDAEMVRQIFQGSQSSQCPNGFQGQLVTRDGGRRNVSWSMKVLATGHVQTILLTGNDQTEQTVIKAELRRIRALSEQTTATINQLSSKLAANAPIADPASASPTTAANIPLEPLEEASENQQRRSRRRAYRVPQWIAASSEDKIPDPNTLVKVGFWDLSACGFSFFMEQLPGFDMLVVALGQAGALTYFSARVMRVARMDHEGRTCYLIGCDFLKRLVS